MNARILSHYQQRIKDNLEYLDNATIRTSLEHFKSNLERETSLLNSASDRKHNLEFLANFYDESLSLLEESEDEMNETISNVIGDLKSLATDSFSDSIVEQIQTSLQNFQLKDGYESFNGLMFEYDTGFNFSGIAFKEPKFEVILENPKYIEFEDGSYACDFPVDFELEEDFEEILSEEFEEIAWEFEYELEIFQKIKETAYAIVAINLHEAMQSDVLKVALDGLGFEKMGVVYLNEHDMEVKSVYVNE